jgi:hypothetical protein
MVLYIRYFSESASDNAEVESTGVSPEVGLEEVFLQEETIEAAAAAKTSKDRFLKVILFIY